MIAFVAGGFPVDRSSQNHSYLHPALVKRIRELLTTADDQPGALPRLMTEAMRLRERIESFVKIGLAAGRVDYPSLELACYALQLPGGAARERRTVTRERAAGLRQRCEGAAELLVGLLGDDIDEPLLDAATRLLQDAPGALPTLQEARLLADAVNLDDFGVGGLFSQAVRAGAAGQGVSDVAAAWRKREEYGYWDARLKDGFHFEAVARVARRRLQQARQVGAMLEAELAEDFRESNDGQ